MIRQLLSCVLFPAAILLERFAYYGMRAVLVLTMMERLAMPAHQASNIMRIFTAGAALTPFLGGILSIAIPPRFTAPIGALISSVGYFVLAGTGNVPLFTGLAIIAVGSGLFRPAFIASAGEVFEKDEPRTSLFCLLYLAINVGAFASTLAIEPVRKDFGVAPVFLGAGAAMITTTLLSVALAFLPFVLPRSEDEREPVPSYRTDVMPYLALIALLVLVLPSYPATDLLFDRVYALGGYTRHLDIVNPLAIIAFVPMVGFAFLGFAIARMRLPFAIPLAIGMAITALATFGALAPRIPTPLAITLFGASAVGEALINPVLLSRFAGGIHPRARTLAVAMLMSSITVPSLVIGLLPLDGIWMTIGVVTSAALCLLFAAAIGVGTPFLSRAFAVDPARL